jgi:hypothetical protein
MGVPQNLKKTENSNFKLFENGGTYTKTTDMYVAILVPVLNVVRMSKLVKLRLINQMHFTSYRPFIFSI